MAACNGDSKAPSMDDPAGPITAHGRWLTDASGRVVVLHGFNDVAKSPPYYPAAFGFGDDDAAFLAIHGFNVLRLGVVPAALMPAPGQIDPTYIDALASTVDDLARHRIFVLLDFHQDGFGPMFNGNGLPDWMAITDGQPNPKDAVFPLYYVQNPAMQRAFDHFWRNSPGPDGTGLQDAFLNGFDDVVTRFAGNPWVLGYEPMNEPWPGSDWQRCADAPGCPDLESSLLAPFYDKARAIVARHDQHQLLFAEPFVLFNFGRAPTTAPAIAGPQVALSFHSYALDPAGEQGVVREALAAAQTQGIPLFATEFGATHDPATLDRIAGELDAAVIPWAEWAYNEGVLKDPAMEASADNLAHPGAFAALVRPYPVLINGTPSSIAFDATTRAFTFTYATTLPNGAPAGAALTTTIAVPALRYPDGYTATAEGADVTSAPCAPKLLLRNHHTAATVTLRITPSAPCAAQ